MDMSRDMATEAVDGLMLVFPRRTIELMQRSVDFSLRHDEDLTAGDQLALREFADLLRHVNLRRAVRMEQYRKDGVTPYWEYDNGSTDPDPLKDAKASVKVMPVRCSECELPDPMHKMNCTKRGTR